jgi:hypothetical protein
MTLWIAPFLLFVFPFLICAPYFLWQRRKGKTWQEIVAGKVDPVRHKRFISILQLVFLGGLILIGSFVAWFLWKYP